MEFRDAWLLQRIGEMKAQRRAELEEAGKRTALVALTPAALAGRVGFADRRGQHRVAGEVVVVVQILVAQSQPEDALAHQIKNRMLHEPGVATVSETPGKALQQLDAAIRLLQQHDARVGGQLPAIKIGQNRSPIEGLDIHRCFRTMCFHQAVLSAFPKVLEHIGL